MRSEENIELIYSIMNMCVNNHNILKMICEEYLIKKNERILKFLLDLCLIEPKLCCAINVILSFKSKSLKYKILNGIELNNKLNLSNNELNDEDIRILSLLISNLCEMRILDLSSNRLSNKSMKYINNIMQSNVNLNEISLKNNQFEDLRMINELKSQRKNARVLI